MYEIDLLLYEHKNERVKAVTLIQEERIKQTCKVIHLQWSVAVVLLSFTFVLVYQWSPE